MANILIFTFPYWGHTHQLLKVAQHLSANGHQVYLDIDEKYSNQADGNIICLNCLFTQNETDAKFVDNEEELYYYADGIMKCCTEYVADLNTFRNLQPDLILYDSSAVWGKEIAIRLNLPYIASVTMQPYILENWIDSQLGKSSRQMKHILMYERILRKKYFQLGPVSFREIIYAKGMRNIVYTSREMCKYANKLDDTYIFVGVIADIPENKEGISEKYGFKKNILISFGTILEKPKLICQCIEALKNMPYSFYINAGQFAELLIQKYNSPHIHICNWQPQLELLQKSALFITHAGHNSMLESVLCGVPMLAIPQVNDEFANAEIIEEMGLGKCLLTPVTTKKIGEASLQIIEDIHIKQRLEKVSNSLQGKDSLKHILNVIEDYIIERCAL